MSPHETVLTFEYEDESRASIVAASIEGELAELAGDRTRAELAREGGVLEVRIEASDLVALRAGINTWCSFVDVASEVAAIGANAFESSGQLSSR
jgi:KEOPS complex subunit Pcc1